MYLAKVTQRHAITKPTRIHKLPYVTSGQYKSPSTECLKINLAYPTGKQPQYLSDNRKTSIVI